MQIQQETLNRVGGKILGLMLMVALTLTSCSNSDSDVAPNDPNQDDGTGSGDLAPDFSLQSLDGSTISLADFDNQVVVLFFFGNSCPSCKAVAPRVESDLKDAYGSRTDYAIVGLDQWDGSKSSVEAFKDNTGVSFPLLLNASGVAGEYSITYDRFVVIDKNGKIAHKGTRAATNDLATVMSLVDGLLQDM